MDLGVLCFNLLIRNLPKKVLTQISNSISMMYVCIFINYKSKVSKILLFCATHNTIHVKDWIKNTFHRSLLATPTCASFIHRLANTDDRDRPIYGLSAHRATCTAQLAGHPPCKSDKTQTVWEDNSDTSC